MKWLNFFAISILASCSSISSAEAQMACGERTSLIEKLQEKYGEARIGGGLTGTSAIFELWASPETGTWTILKTTPDGLSCVMAVGEAWETEQPAIPMKGGGEPI